MMGETQESDATDPESREEAQEHDVVMVTHVAPEFKDKIDTRRLRDAARRTLDRETRLPASIELALVVGDDEQLHELNQRFRGVDAPTDVLSFAMPVANGTGTGIGEGPVYLGDVIISFPRAEAQARDAGHPTEDELDLLVVHGVLHLLGYDHDTDDRKSLMWDKQEAILGKKLID